MYIQIQHKIRQKGRETILLSNLNHGAPKQNHKKIWTCNNPGQNVALFVKFDTASKVLMFKQYIIHN